MFYFPGDLVGPDPSSRLYCIFRDSWTRWSRWSRWSHRSSPLRFVLYFPGLMRARRLRLNRHHRQWILPLSSNYIFQAGGAASRPWQKSYLFPEIWIHPGTPLCSSQVFSSGHQLPRLRCVLYYIFRAKGPFRLRGQTVNSRLVDIRHLFDSSVQG